MCVSVPLLYNAHGGQKRALESQELQLQMLIGHRVGAGIRTQVSQCS